MIDYKYSVCLIIPIAYLEAINQFGEAIGYGPNSLSIPLSATGYDPPTHYGGHTWAMQSFLDIIQNGLQGTLPKELEGNDPQQVAFVLSQMKTSINSEGTPLDHWRALLTSEGLSLIEYTQDQV